MFQVLDSKMKNWIVGRVSFDEIIPKVDLDLSDFNGKTVDRNDYKPHDIKQRSNKFSFKQSFLIGFVLP